MSEKYHLWCYCWEEDSIIGLFGAYKPLIALILALATGDSVESGPTLAALPITGPDGTPERCEVEGSSLDQRN